jgi:hypothetical protein
LEVQADERDDDSVGIVAVALSCSSCIADDAAVFVDWLVVFDDRKVNRDVGGVGGIEESGKRRMN